MANTLCEAMTGAQPVDWGRLIHEYVEKFIPHIGWKSSYLSPTPRIRKLASPPPPPPRSEAKPSREAHRKDVDISAYDFLEAPFKLIHDELVELQTQY